jgi:hypothetical protein
LNHHWAIPSSPDAGGARTAHDCTLILVVSGRDPPPSAVIPDCRVSGKSGIHNPCGLGLAVERNHDTGVMDSGLALRAPRNDKRYRSRDAVCIRVVFTNERISPQTKGRRSAERRTNSSCRADKRSSHGPKKESGPPTINSVQLINTDEILAAAPCRPLSPAAGLECDRRRRVRRPCCCWGQPASRTP